MKSIAASKAQDKWPRSDVKIEANISNRRADVLVAFFERHDRLGDGVAIECQYKNSSKDIGVVTEDFRNAGYSVLWVYENHYSDKDVDLESAELCAWWPSQVPEIDGSPHRFISELANISPDTVIEASFPPRWYDKEIRDAVREGRRQRRKEKRKNESVNFTSKKKKRRRDIHKTRAAAEQRRIENWNAMYEGWDEDTQRHNTVKVFSKTDWRWVEVSKKRIPNKILKEKATEE